MKKLFSKLMILIIVFVAVVATIFLKEKKEIPEVIASMGTPSLPIVTYIGSNVVELNETIGYTVPMNERYMRDTLTPIDASRHLTVRVHKYSNVVMGASFELRSLDTERLIENRELDRTQLEQHESYTDIQITFDNLLEENTEYWLRVELKTDRFEQIFYYTRIIILTENYCSEQIEFANMFSNATFDSTRSDEIVSYLEPNASRDNSNLGEVDIHSSFNQITWGNLEPIRMTNPVVSVKEVIDTVTCLELKYKIAAMNDYDVMQYYNVTEFYRIKWTSTEIYLLNYYRETNQIFDATNQNISNTRINLGIDSDGNVDFLASPSGKKIAFTKENGLWLMDISSNVVHPLITYEKIEDADIRTRNDNSQIRILSVTDAGDVEFLSYGYVNRGEHEGAVGVSLYHYNTKENAVNEKVFIPFNQPYGILKETVGKLAYVNKNNVMYLMVNGNIYSVDLTGNEYVPVVSDLSDDQHQVNESGDCIAWQMENEISTLDLETGVEQVITPEAGKYIRLLGYVQDDLVYGVAESNMIQTDQNGVTTTYMSELRIVSESGELLKSYSNPGFYFTDIVIEENMITLHRVVSSVETGTWMPAPDYQVFGNEQQELNAVGISVIATERKKQELVLNFVVKVTSSNKLKRKYPAEITMVEENTLSIRELASTTDQYYVYGIGKVVGIYDEINQAIKKADTVYGVVTNATGRNVWARISKPTQHILSNVKMTQTAGEQDFTGQLAVCMNSLLAASGVNADVLSEVQAGKSAVEILKTKQPKKAVYDLRGCTLNQVLYYVCQGQPVLATIHGSGSVLIVGYDFYNAVLLNPVTGQTYKQGLEETEEQVKQSGYKFICIAEE